MFDALKKADVTTVGNLSVGAGIALGVYETFAGSKPNYLWPGLLVAGGVVAHIAVMNPKSITALGQAASSSGAASAASGANVARDLGENAEREEQVKKLPYVIGGAALTLLALKILL